MADEDPYPHIRDTDTVFIQSTLTGAVGSCLGKAFKEIWSKRDHVQIDRAAFDAGMEILQAQQNELAANREAPLDGDAQDIINAERGITSPRPAGLTEAAAAAGFELPDDEIVAGRHAGEG